VKLGAFLDSKRHRAAIDKVRTAASKEEKDSLKKDLPCATISGTFSVRNMAGIVEYNGLVCLDFDAKENPGHTADSMKAILAEFEEVFYAGKSVSGAGVYAIVPTNNTDITCHARVVDVLGELFNGEGLVYDRACKDVSRLRIISYDDKPVVNQTPAVFDAARFLPAMAQQVDRPPRPIFAPRSAAGGDDKTRERVERYISEAMATAQDVTNDYEDWYKIGLALASEFGITGEPYFQQISSLSSKYNQAECAKKYYSLCQKGSKVKIGTFFHILKNQGITI